jgi:hypothetical protein
MRQADFKYVTVAAVNSAGVPKTDHRLVRLDLVFKFMPRRLRAVKPRIDRTLLDEPVVKLKFHSSQVWLRIRCRVVIQVLSSLPLQWCVGCCT